MAKLFANSGDPAQMLHSVTSDLGLHLSPITLLGVSRLKWVTGNLQVLPVFQRETNPCPAE